MITILLIEDELGIRGLLGTLLKRKGYDVVLADSGKHGLALFRKEKPHAVVLDLKLPDISGLTVFKEIRAMDPRQPVIIFTGAAITETERQALEIGPVEFVQKEFSLHRLGEALTRLLGNDGASERLEARLSRS